MKSTPKYLFFIFILLSTANAQIISDYGIKTGMVFSKQEMDLKKFSEEILILNPYESYRLSPVAGFYIRYFDWTYSDFEIEVSYVQKGANVADEYKPFNPDGWLQFDYIRLKNALRLKIESRYFECYCIFGLSIDYLFATAGQSRPLDDYTKYVMGFHLGFSVSSDYLFNNRIFLEFTYNPDMTDINESRWARYHNSLFSLKLGLSLKKCF